MLFNKGIFIIWTELHQVSPALYRKSTRRERERERERESCLTDVWQTKRKQWHCEKAIWKSYSWYLLVYPLFLFPEACITFSNHRTVFEFRVLIITILYNIKPDNEITQSFKSKNNFMKTVIISPCSRWKVRWFKLTYQPH